MIDPGLEADVPDDHLSVMLLAAQTRLFSLWDVVP